MKRANIGPTKAVLEDLESFTANGQTPILFDAIYQAGKNGWLDSNAVYYARQLVTLASHAAGGVDNAVCLAAAMKLIPKEATWWMVQYPGYAEIKGPAKKLPGCFDGVPQNPRRPRGPMVAGTNRNAQGRGSTPALALAAACFRARIGDA